MLESLFVVFSKSQQTDRSPGGQPSSNTTATDDWVDTSEEWYVMLN